MEIEPIADTTEAARWHLVFLLLSMDRVKPFWPDLHLPQPWSATVQQMARSLVQQYRQIEADSDLTTAQRIEKLNALYQTTFQDIASYDKDAAEALYNWGKQVFQYDLNADADIFLWGFLFRRLADLSSQSYPLVPLQLPKEKLDSVKAAILKHMASPSALQQRIKASEREALSEWDEQVLKTYTADASPMDWVLNTIGFINTTSAWKDIEKILGRDDLMRLRQWGAQQAKVMGMAAYPPDNDIKAN